MDYDCNITEHRPKVYTFYMKQLILNALILNITIL